MFSEAQKTRTRHPTRDESASVVTSVSFFWCFFAPAAFTSLLTSRNLMGLFFFNAAPDRVVGYALVASSMSAMRFAVASARVTRGARVWRVRTEPRFTGGRIARVEKTRISGSERSLTTTIRSNQFALAGGHGVAEEECCLHPGLNLMWVRTQKNA